MPSYQPYLHMTQICLFLVIISKNYVLGPNEELESKSYQDVLDRYENPLYGSYK